MCPVRQRSKPISALYWSAGRYAQTGSKHIFRASCAHAPTRWEMDQHTRCEGNLVKVKKQARKIPFQTQNHLFLRVSVLAYVSERRHMWVGWQTAEALLRVCRHSAEITHTWPRLFLTVCVSSQKICVFPGHFGGEKLDAWRSR